MKMNYFSFNLLTFLVRSTLWLGDYFVKRNYEYSDGAQKKSNLDKYVSIVIHWILRKTAKLTH